MWVILHRTYVLFLFYPTLVQKSTRQIYPFSPEAPLNSYAIRGLPSSTWMTPRRAKPCFSIRCRIVPFLSWVSIRRHSIRPRQYATHWAKTPFPVPSPATRLIVP